jgi:hypothetical protein
MKRTAVLLRQYVELHNERRFDEMMALFCDDAEMHFVRDGKVVLGPFVGRSAIAEAFRLRPPDDELVLLQDHGTQGATYAWRSRPDLPAGTIRLRIRGDSIAEIVVTFAA